jgi:hypothetical protein
MAALNGRLLLGMGLAALIAGWLIFWAVRPASAPDSAELAETKTAVANACQRFLNEPLPPVLVNEQPFRHAVHTLFLDEYVASLAAAAGFDTVVQVFPWRDFNPEPGVYEWDAADYMVQLARQYNLELVVRMDMPPEWAVLPVESGIPFDVAAYGNYVSAVAGRYRGQVLGYIIWNEPNLAAEWSRSGGEGTDHWVSYEGWVAEAADYTAVLGLAYQRIRTADPGALVVGGGMAPTNEQSRRGVDDRDFLEAMLAAGAADCLDVLAVHDYGYGLSPEAERGAQDGLNLARIMDLREIMLAHQARQPFWITELGYTIGPAEHPSISEEKQALYLLGAFERTRRDWPYVEMLTVWNLVYGRPYYDEMSGYSLVEPDLSPRLAYEMLSLMEKLP